MITHFGGHSIQILIGQFKYYIPNVDEVEADWLLLQISVFRFMYVDNCVSHSNGFLRQWY